MVYIKDILMALDKLAPFDNALSNDNVGMLIGDKNAVFSGCVIALDCTTEVVDYAVKTGSNLIITHHPVIFSPIKSVLAEDIVFKLIRADINVISAHTNLDIAENGVNKVLADRLGLINQRVFENCYMVGLVGELPHSYSADEFADFLKLTITSSEVCYVDCNREISTVAVVGGAGDDFISDSVIADAYVTGEARYNCYPDAKNAGIQLFTLGHYQSEAVVLKPLGDYLSAEFGKTLFNLYENPPFKCI